MKIVMLHATIQMDRMQFGNWLLEGGQMMLPSPDTRKDDRKAQDEQLAAEAPLPTPSLQPGQTPKPIETHLGKTQRRPLAVAGIVENGVVRPLDPHVKLPEHSRVIIVASANM